MAHICGDDGAVELGDHARQFVGTAGAGGDLGLQVGHILSDVARRMAARGEQGAGFGIPQAAGVDQQKVVDQDALVLDRLRRRRHRSGRRAADIGVMAPGGHEEGGCVVGLEEDRHDDGDVRKMRATVVGGVQHIGVTALHAPAVGRISARADDGANALAHRAQMDRDVRSIGDQGTGGVEDGTGEVQPLLDVDRIGRGPKRLAHLLSCRHEAAVEDLEHDRVGIRAQGGASRQGCHPGEDQVQGVVGGRAPAGLQYGRSGVLEDDGGPVDRGPGTEGVAAIDGGVVVSTRHPDEDARDGNRHACLAKAGRRRSSLIRCGHGFRLERFHDQGLVFGEEAEPLAVQRLERRLHSVGRAEGYGQRCIRAEEFDLGANQGRDHAVRKALGRQELACLGGKCVGPDGERRVAARREWRGHSGLADGPHIGKAHAPGREHAGVGVEHHPRHPQRVGHEAGVLAAGAAETVQHIAGDVIAALDRHRLDRLGHVLDSDGDEAFGQGFRCRLAACGETDVGSHGLEPVPHGPGIQRLVPVRAEDGWELVRPQLAQHDVAVCHRQRAPATIGGRARHGPGGLRPDPQARAVEATDRTAARGHCVNAQHRGAQPDAGHHRVRGPLIVAGEMRDVGRGAAHVEADNAVVARRARRLGHAHHAARRSGQDGVLAPERARRRQAAAGLHEKQRRSLAQIGPDPIDIGAQDR